MDSSTVLRRTSAGDSEVAVPANGLSITQRRILTLLDTPVPWSELPLDPPIEPPRLRREVQRLAQAGLIACETPVTEAAAANAETLRRLDAPRLVRRIPLLLLALATVAVVWVAVRLTAAPAATAAGTSAPAAAKTAAPGTIAPVAPVEPPVIATRVLRGEPQPAKDSRTPGAARAGAPSEPAATASGRRAEVETPLAETAPAPPGHD